MRSRNFRSQAVDTLPQFFQFQSLRPTQNWDDVLGLAVVSIVTGYGRPTQLIIFTKIAGSQIGLIMVKSPILGDMRGSPPTDGFPFLLSTIAAQTWRIFMP